MAKLSWKRNVSVTSVIAKVVSTGLGMWIGGKVMAAIATSMTDETPIFIDGLEMLGFDRFTNASHDYLTGNLDQSAVVTVIGLVGAASIVLEFVKVSF